MPEDERPGQGLDRGRKKKLTGEEKVWHKIAGRIGKSVGEAKDAVSSTEFLRWLRLFEEEWNDQDRTIFQLAQIAYQVYLLFFILGGSPTRKVEDFVLSFTLDSEENKNNLIKTGQDLEAEANTQRAIWKGMVGAHREVQKRAEGNRPDKKPPVEPAKTKPRKKGM